MGNVQPPEVMTSHDQWEVDCAMAEAFVEGMAFQLERTAGKLAGPEVEELRRWASSFGLFFAGRPQDISGMEGEKSLAEWFRYWRYVETTDQEDGDGDYPDAPPEQDADGYREGDIDLSSPTESAESIRAGER